MTVLLAVEGETDIEVALKLVESVGLSARYQMGGNGKDYLDSCVPGLNRSGKQLNWLILRDLDRDAPCAPTLVQQVLKNQPLARGVCFRIAERAVESWLLADHEAFSARFSVLRNRLPSLPDQLDNPKGFLVKICRKSQDAYIRDAMVHRRDGNKPVGPAYENVITSFIRDSWKPERAARRSPSLKRALERIRAMKAEGRWT